MSLTFVTFTFVMITSFMENFVVLIMYNYIVINIMEILKMSHVTNNFVF